MKFVVVAIPNPSVDRAPIQAAETAAVGELHRSGMIDCVYARADGASSLTVLEAETEAEAREAIERLPFYIHGAMAVDIFEVRQVL
ncbi:hypothetical protein [Rhodococcus globerulus]|uniref:Muconolactone isomerase domain-containing protein n=1 Tax=Rhodococcus globerulus TaxID=33008 RepID=A0ABU4C3R7_RHOGO|nr:hypothetical protein [Rhodococcus globerulus]MDV6271150.1 hypothetical protein [Rhodococcus globerulus]